MPIPDALVAIDPNAPAPMRLAALLPSELPDRAPPLDAAAFERLLEQARVEQARVEFVDAGRSVGAPGLDAMVGHVRTSSREYVERAEASMKSLADLDLTDPRAFGRAMHDITVTAIQGVQLSVVLGEVSSSKKSLQQLFHNQG